MLDQTSIISITMIVVLVALSAFFSATETAFSSASRIRLKNYLNSGDKRAIKAIKIADDYDKTLSAVLIGNNIVNIAAASIGTFLFTHHFGSAGIGLSTIVMTIIVLIFGEIIPKSIAKEHPESFALSVSSILYFLIKLFTPIIAILMGIKNLLTSKFIKKNDKPTVTEEELLYILEEIEDEGVLNSQETELVQSALEFNDITVSEILTPRVDVVAIDVTETQENIKELFFSLGYSRLPVFERSIDNIIGVLNEKDFLKSYLNDRNVDIRKLIQKTIFVPPKKIISDLLKEIQQQKLHLVVVSDQYGGTLGIVTLEDILEELVGEIWDESDEVDENIVKISDNKFKVSGDMGIYDLFEILELDEALYSGSSQSMSGFALEQFDEIPKEGESFMFENMKVTAAEIVEQRIVTLMIEFPIIQ